MIVGIEGLSSAGKTTLINKYLEKYPDTIRFRGAGAVNIGILQHWQDYNFWMRNIIEQLDSLNGYKKVILWDRFLTDAVYSEDKLYASEILRVMKSHKHKAVIYIEAEKALLVERKSKEGDDYDAHDKAYKRVLKSFNTHTIILQKDENYYITDRVIDEMHQFINKLSDNI
jgi:thymidylate kinase